MCYIRLFVTLNDDDLVKIEKLIYKAGRKQLEICSFLLEIRPMQKKARTSHKLQTMHMSNRALFGLKLLQKRSSEPLNLKRFHIMLQGLITLYDSPRLTLKIPIPDKKKKLT